MNMFARKVAALLKPNSLPEFSSLMESRILPWLREQEGFLDLITLVLPDGREVASISFWNREADAEAYHATGYPEVLEILEGLLDAGPYVKTFKVVSSTLPLVAPGRDAEAIPHHEMDSRREASLAVHIGSKDHPKFAI